MKAIFDLIYVFFIDHLLALLKDAFRGTLYKLEIAALHRGRLLFLLFIFAIVNLLLLFFGFVLLHIALFLFLPWEPENKAFLILGLGLFYMILSITFICLSQSRRRWLQAAARLRNKASSDSTNN